MLAFKQARSSRSGDDSRANWLIKSASPRVSARSEHDAAAAEAGSRVIGASWDFSGAASFAADRTRAEAPGGVCQAKLLVGASDDPLEHEADHVADAAMSRMDTRDAASPPATSDPVAAVRAKSVEAGHAQPVEAPAVVSNAIGGSAEPLDPTLRTRLERRFAYDFGQVRVHRDGVAAQAAEALGARAFTTGKDVVFGAGQYAPATSEGQRLIAHELTHVAQQGAAGIVRRDPIPSAKLTADPTRGTLTEQQKLQIDSVLRSHQVVVYRRERRARFDGQAMTLQQAIGIVRREAGILLPSDDAIAAYIDLQFSKYIGAPGAGGGNGAATTGVLRQGIPMPYGLDRPLRTLEPSLTGADIDRIRGFLAAGRLASAPGLRPIFNGAPTSLDDITEKCRALVLPIIPANKVSAIVWGEWSILVRKALQAPLPPPLPFTISWDEPGAKADSPDKPDKLVAAVGWQGTWHLTRKAASEHTVQVQLTQGDGSVTRVYQFQVNTTTGDVQAMLGVQAQSPDVTLVDKKLFKAVQATIKASAFVQLIGGITNVGGNSASGSLTLQLQGGVQAAVTLGPISATIQVGPTLTLQQGSSPDLSLNPAALGGGTQLQPGEFPPFHGITVLRGTF